MVINLFFYSTKHSVDFAVVFFVVDADFANERHHHSETPTDQSHHNLSIHRIIRSVGNSGQRLVLRFWLELQRQLGATQGRLTIQDFQRCLVGQVAMWCLVQVHAQRYQHLFHVPV
jgi:hypothetical protein